MKCKTAKLRFNDSTKTTAPEGPTPWVSPLEVASKKTRILFCVDMRLAIESERHQVPTADELIVALNGTVFSKIDVNQGRTNLSWKKTPEVQPLLPHSLAISLQATEF